MRKILEQGGQNEEKSFPCAIAPWSAALCIVDPKQARGQGLRRAQHSRALPAQRGISLTRMWLCSIRNGFHQELVHDQSDHSFRLCLSVSGRP
jgi:hypothetical protein